MSASSVTITWPDDHTVSIVGELDMNTVPALRDALRSPTRRRLTVDLAGLTFIDAGGLSEFIRAHAVRTFTMRNLSASVTRTFVIGGCAALLAASGVALEPDAA